MTRPWSAFALAVVAALTASPTPAAELLVHVQSSAGTPVADAVIYAVPAFPVAPAKGARYSIDQVNRQFVPRINVVQTGTTVRFPNSDNIRHSVYSFSPARVFTLKLYAGQSAEPVVFDRPGLVVLGCNIHDQMVSWLLVVDTPYFARTDRTGTATLGRLPPGDYTLRAWDESLSEEQQTAEALHVNPGMASMTHMIHLEAASTPAATRANIP